jgi:hypothetical protein
VLTLRYGARLPLDQSPAHDDLIALWAAEDAGLQPLVADLRRLRDWFFFFVYTSYFFGLLLEGSYG